MDSPQLRQGRASLFWLELTFFAPVRKWMDGSILVLKDCFIPRLSAGAALFSWQRTKRKKLQSADLEVLVLGEGAKVVLISLDPL